MPVVGDWNDDGTDDLGLFNDDRYFYLDATLNGTWDGVAGGDAFHTFNYGIGGTPVAGRWSLPSGVLPKAPAKSGSQQAAAESLLILSP